MRRENQNPQAVNRWGLYSSVCGLWSYALWPTVDASIFDHMLPVSVAAIAAGGAFRAGKGLRQDHSVRKALAAAGSPSGKFGSADFASLEERLNIGLHDSSGLAFLGQADGLPTFLPSGNLLIEAMQGSGKTSCVIVPTILHLAKTGRSVCVADSKPEIVHMLADVLRGFGIRVRINNPSRRDGLPHDDSNPFQLLIDVLQDEDGSHEAATIAEALAKVIVPDATDGKSKYFTQIDQQVLMFVLLGLATLHPRRCYPAQVWKHLSDPDALEHLLFEAKDSEALSGDLAIMARALLHKDRTNPEHLEGGRTGAANALSPFKPSSSLGHYGADHSFNAADARDPSKAPMVVFDVMPSDQLDVYSKVYELTNTSRVQALKRSPKGREVVIVADECTAMPLRAIASEIEFIRSFKIRFIGAYQSWASLKRVYGEARAESLKANCAQLYFSVNDLKSAKDISERVGEYTIKTESYGFSDERNPSKNIGETGRRRLPPEELMALGRDQAIMMVPGMRPVKLRTVPWYEIAPIKDQLGENPHEQHQKSSVTRLTMTYGKDAGEIGPPVVPDFKERLAGARKIGGVRGTPARVPLVRPYKFLWVPLVAAFLAFTLTAGTPHLAWMQSPNRNGGWTCGYLGIAGFELVTSSRGCPSVVWLPPHAEEL